jgi:hypothetical protein
MRRTPDLQDPLSNQPLLLFTRNICRVRIISEDLGPWSDTRHVRSHQVELEVALAERDLTCVRKWGIRNTKYCLSMCTAVTSSHGRMTNCGYFYCSDPLIDSAGPSEWLKGGSRVE